MICVRCSASWPSDYRTSAYEVSGLFDAMTKHERLFVNWYANLIERLARTRHYVRQIASTSPGYERGVPHLVQTLEASIEDLALWTYEHSVAFLEGINRGANLTTYYANLRGISKEFRGLHQKLILLPNPWAPRELDGFIH